MNNPFVLIGIFVIVTGISLISLGLGSLSSYGFASVMICFPIGIVAIIMGISLIQLMKDDTLYEQPKTDQVK